MHPFIMSIFGGPSPWDCRRRRAKAVLAYKRGEKELMREWPRETDEDEHGLAVALGKLRAHFGA